MKKILVLFVLILVSGCVNNVVEIDNGVGSIRVNVEIADDLDERRIGLMYRERLGEDNGMFFIFEDSKIRHFWMKNTLIPLDIIFISGDFEILNIEKALPCEEDPCKTYSSESDARYVLEVNQGFSERNNINVGDKVKLI